MVIKLKNIYKLSTKEDYKFIHKFFGISCLLNFIYQFYYLFTYGNMNLDNNKSTPIILFFHSALSLSSLIFHVPKNRHQGLPMIYKEFRLHSIIFALRSVICSLLFYYKISMIYNYFVINLTMILADIITYKYKVSNTTMRGMPFEKNIGEKEKKSVTLMHSCHQFSANLFMITNINSAFSPLLAIQLAAFLMTLVRKSIISPLDWHRFYALSLWINIFVYWSFNDLRQPITVILGTYIFTYLRINCRFNKYLVWNCLFIIIHIFKNHENLNLSVDKYTNRIITNCIIVLYLLNQVSYSLSLWI